VSKAIEKEAIARKNRHTTSGRGAKLAVVGFPTMDIASHATFLAWVTGVPIDQHFGCLRVSGGRDQLVLKNSSHSTRGPALATISDQRAFPGYGDKFYQTPPALITTVKLATAKWGVFRKTTPPPRDFPEPTPQENEGVDGVEDEGNPKASGLRLLKTKVANMRNEGVVDKIRGHLRYRPG